MSTLPPVYECLSQSEDASVEDLLLEQWGDLEEPYQAWAVEVLLQRARPVGLRRLVDMRERLPGGCQDAMVRELARFEAALPEAIRSPRQQTRYNAIEMISSGRACSLAYILPLGLRHTASETRRRAADALLGLVRDHLAAAVPEEWSADMRDALPAIRLRLENLRHLREHLVTALREAIAAYPSHVRTTVVEAAMLLSENLETEILGEARRWPNKFWSAAIEKLYNDPGDSAAAFALQALADPDTRGVIAKMLSQCTATSFFRALWRHSWLLGDPRVRDGLQLVRRMLWLEEQSAELLDLEASELRQALRFVSATSIPVATRIELCRTILLAGDAEKQLIALFAMIDIPHKAAEDGLQAVIQWAEPRLAELARRELRRRQALTEPPPGTFEEEEAPAVNADPAQDFAVYWRRFPRLEPQQQVELGRAVLARDGHALGKLQARLKSSDEEQRLQAMQIIRLLDLTPRYADEVLEAVRDYDRKVRSAAVKALQHVGGPARERLLVEALQDSDGRVRANAVEVLASGDLERLVHQLIPRLRDPHHRVRTAAIDALLRLKIPAAAEALLKLLKNPSRAHRTSGLWLIEKLDIADVVDQVSRIAREDPDQQVRRRARRILRAARRRKHGRVPIPDPGEGDV